MSLAPWYRVAQPREDLRQGRALDAAQFAVHLDRVVAGEAPPEYGEAEKFFERTYLTEGLRNFSSQVVRRLSGEHQDANPVLHLVTGFGGGKTHALTLLYHLATLGPDSKTLRGVTDLLDRARLNEVPSAAVAVFVGSDWDVVTGRTGHAEPHRHTPWGEIAWRLADSVGQHELFEAIREQDEARIAPGKEAIRAFLPPDRPVLILMDEVMNFMTRARGVRVGESTLASQFYEFVHNLTEEADSRSGLCVVVSLPKSEGEMSAEDYSDQDRLANVTRRVAEPWVLAKDLEIPEIVRRRLFDSVGTDSEIGATARAFARWMDANRTQLPSWFPVDRAEEYFRASYPFNPTLLSVFERKWQALPSFGKTRGILRLLAQWVSIAYHEGFQGAHSDPLIGIGTAPLDDQPFRTSVLDQLGNASLEAAIISDVAGERSFAFQLDGNPETPEALRSARIHTKAATAVFFESSGGQAHQYATLPEIRLDVGEPDVDIGNVETALDNLRDRCHYLVVEAGEYRFSTRPNLNRLVADRRASLRSEEVTEHARAQIRSVFSERRGVLAPLAPVFFPPNPNDVDDIPALQIVILAPDQRHGGASRSFIESCISASRSGSRRFGNGLIFAIPDDANPLLDAARSHLAWEKLETDARDLEPEQLTQLVEQKRRSEQVLRGLVWRTFRFLGFLGSDGSVQDYDLGMVHESSADSMQALVQARLRQRDELTEVLAPTRVVQNWPGTGDEWSTKELRDAVYASPRFTRLLNPDSLRDTICRGVKEGIFGYAAKRDNGVVQIRFRDELTTPEVEFSDDVVLVLPELALSLKEAAPSPETPILVPEPDPQLPDPAPPTVITPVPAEPSYPATPRIRWSGQVPPLKWTTFYTKVLSRLVNAGGLTLNVDIDSHPDGGLSQQQVDAMRDGLRDLGLATEVEEP